MFLLRQQESGEIWFTGIKYFYYKSCNKSISGAIASLAPTHTVSQSFWAFLRQQVCKLKKLGLNDNLLDKFTLIVVWMNDLLWGICVTCVDHTVVMMNWIISFLENFQLGWIRLTKFICLLSWIDKISYIDVNGDGDTRYITWRVSVRGKKSWEI